MKFAVALLAVLAMSSPLDAWKLPRSGPGPLVDDLQAFLDLLPLNKMVSILLEYVSEDAEFQKLLTYLKSDDFKNLIIDVEAIPEVVDLLNYIQAAGVDAYALVNKANNFLGIPPMKKPFVEVYKITGGIRGFLDDIEALVPVQAVKDLYAKKLAQSKAFADLIERLKSPSTQKIIDKIHDDPYFNGVLNKAVKAGIDVAAVKEFLERLLGLKFPDLN